MTEVLRRIAVDARANGADDLTGGGAKATGGRWNVVDHPMVYASSTRALSRLEIVVHLNAGGLPLDRYLMEITVPDVVWLRARHETAASLPVKWDAEPASRTSIDVGTTWLVGGETALLLVPSVIVPEDYTILINPAHGDSSRLGARKLRQWTHDPRLTRR